MMKQLDRWHQTKIGLLVFAAVELAVAYGFGSLAVDRGNFLWYLLALLFLFGSIQNSAKLIGGVVHGHSK